MRKWLPVSLVLAGLAFGAMAYPRLSDPVFLRWETLGSSFALPPAEPLSREFVAFVFPSIAFAVWLLLRGLATPTAERVGRRVFPEWLVSERTGAEGVTRFRPTYDAIAAGVVGLLLLMHGLTLAMALGWAAWTAQVMTAVLGVGLVAVGNIMPRTRPNWVAGLRTKRTLSDPDVWRRAHRWFGGLLMLAGAGVVVASLFGALVALLVALIGTLASAVAATIVSNRGAAVSSGLPAL